jgi:hypothetical protein
MTVGFFHVDRESVASKQMHECARGLVQSVRESMPGVPVVHFTDETSKGVKGVDAVRRKPAEPMALLRMRHHAGVKGAWLFVDTDVLIQKNVARVFSIAEFDIALARRDWSHLKVAPGFSDRMPYNTGVVFSRCPRFWAEVYTRLRVLDAPQQEWMGDQEVICDLVTEDRPRYAVTFVSGAKYNYPPMLPGVKAADQLHEASIVHYKGPDRKALMLARIAEARKCA